MTDAPLSFRRARSADVPDIVRMLADDPLGATRERDVTPLPESYARAFRAIDSDPNNELVVADQDGRVVGVLQLTFIPSLTYQGGWRALIEGVRVDARVRSQGLGRALFEWAIARARARLPCRPAHDGQGAPRRQAFLRSPRLRRLARGHEAVSDDPRTDDAGSLTGAPLGRGTRFL
jgi:GNAT superfamily N-acetyltransferase